MLLESGKNPICNSKHFSFMSGYGTVRAYNFMCFSTLLLISFIFLRLSSSSRHPANICLLHTYLWSKVVKSSIPKEDTAMILGCSNTYIHHGVSSSYLWTRRNLIVLGFSGHFFWLVPVNFHHGRHSNLDAFSSKPSTSVQLSTLRLISQTPNEYA